jgi:hypothetical protein
MRVSATLLVLLTACAQGGAVAPAPQQPEPKPQERADPADQRLRAKTKVKLVLYAFEAYPPWSAAHPDKACPETLAELNEYINSSDTNDAWGRPLKMLCGAALPAGAQGIGVLSVGKDGKEGTDDDIKSWELNGH